MFKHSNDLLPKVRFMNTFQKFWGFHQKAVSCSPNDVLLRSPAVHLLVFLLFCYIPTLLSRIPSFPLSCLNSSQSVLLKVPIKCVQPFTCTFILSLPSPPTHNPLHDQKKKKYQGVRRHQVNEHNAWNHWVSHNSRGYVIASNCCSNKAEQIQIEKM